MLSKNTCYKILLEMRDDGQNVTRYINLVSSNTIVPKEVIQFINNQRPLKVTEYYDELRKLHNKKHVKLYKELLEESRDDIQRMTKVLSSYITRALIYTENMDGQDKFNFLENARIPDCSVALSKYFIDKDDSLIKETFDLIRTDIKILENKE